MTTADTFLINSLQRQIAQALPPATQYVVAFSGGMDSHVLLHAMSGLRESISAPLSAVHVHHGLQDQADEWSVICEQLAHALDISSVCLHVAIDRNHSDGLEAAARQARYQALKDWLPDGAALLTAHHQRDQAETLLLQLLRGAGPKGLAAMPAEIAFGRGQLVRPLLTTPYEQLQDYADQMALSWIDDPSNDSTTFDRNLLRHDFMPEFRSRWPGLDQVLSRAARHQASATRLMDDLARIDLQGSQGSDLNTLSVETLLGLPPYRRNNLIRYWIHQHKCRLPSEAVLERVTAELLQSRADAMPCVHWDDVEIRRFQDALYLMSALPDVPSDWSARLSFETLELPAGGRLDCESVTGSGISAAMFSEGVWKVIYRQGGERIKPAGNTHTRTLKRLLQEQGVPPWLRARLPLVFCNDQLVAVAQLWVAEGFAAGSGEAGRLFRWSELK